ncbi:MULTISPECIES: ribonuclease R family protein [unclassified Lentimonas]|uniref:ribonuclease R family protein n=1 Tax=unclassified Lentimonas TaxID=2630993 RepID=UPI00132C2FBA|nr:MULTISPECIES: RNB domain-containing ribonuclease [unclassified Lentimonas]CAA6677402.1 3'-to-5' exoribonuclease RNase R [Lentimonas sp. CC4]CAA6686947.1 3'-to-5' exoribonuclease RNase R [Lentimonas sp. CC6]CAA7074648.1 3'-to-5' exoribonuclease RNase R [Lentimonas sp. CC4]CAA7169270.1 3'-to-5' exoribonuclease RNase R [Lentimonas sp. CC21]CAA7180335.1 3'-to-5' exoribonuclease RNase R [Lentimonas sp. CC8]
MELRQKLLKLFKTKDYVPMRREEVIAVLRLTPKEANDANFLIDQMLERGQIARLKKDKLCIPDDADLVSGRIMFRQNGAATLVPDATEDKPSVAISQGYPVSVEDTGVAMHADQVLARIIRRQQQRPYRGGRDKRPAYDPTEKPNVRVIRILKRAREAIPGALEKGRHTYYVIPDDPRITQDILVPEPSNSGIKPIPKVGDKVVVKLLEWTQRHLNPEGEITEVLGTNHEPDAEFKSILYKYNLNPQFPAAVEKQTNSIPDHVREEDTKGRMDCRDIFTFTIDPDDAKDFDDAISLEELDGGKIRVGVHIADVSAYVKPGTPLDVEAQERANSTYLVGTVIPMLPHALSNGLCSLVEAQDRLTKTCFITFSPQAEVVGVDFANTVIRSNKRLTYKQAFAFMQEDDLEVVRKTPLPPKHQTGSTGRSLDEVSDDEMQLLQKYIRKSWDIASQLRKRRFTKGSLDLDMTSVKIYVDEEGYADRLEKEVNDESHQLIEEFMLSANEQVAKATKRANFPSIYRVHDEPEDEKLQELRETMLTFGVQCGNLGKPREMSMLLKKLKEHPQGYTLKVQVLRSLKQAQYRASADGHYGLAKPDYTHFTSPIRRYSDLIVHRVLDGYMHKMGVDSAPDEPDIRYTQGKLLSLGDHLSVSERNSVDAERDSTKTKLLEFYERELEKPEKQSFKAIITDVKNHGLFIELTDSLAFGMVHISTLEDDFYNPSHDGTALVGRRSKKSYSLGQYIMVQVERVDRFKRQIDFRVTATTDKIDRRMDPKKQRRSKGRQASADRINKGKSKGGFKKTSVAPLTKRGGASGGGAKKRARPFKKRK